MRKWLPIIPLLVAVGLTAMAYGDLPPVVTPDWGLLLPVDVPPEGMGRLGFAVLMPVVGLAVWVLLTLVARVRGSKTGIVPEHLAAAAIERFEPTFHIVVLGVVGLIALMHIALLAAAAGWPAWTLAAVGVTLGAGLLAIGNIMPRARPNWVVGIRTRGTLTDPALWTRVHRYFGAFLMLAGVATAIVAFVATRYTFVIAIGGVLVSAVLAHLLAATRTPSTAPVVACLLAALLAVKADAQAGEPREVPFDVRSGGLTLPGTLALPANAKPDVVLIVAGSGPTDRNGNGPLTKTDLYKQIARGLADSGFASLRYDKRGLGPAGMTIDHSALSVDDYVADVAAAVDALIADGRFGRVFLLGHSEGSMHVTLAANRGARVAGVVLLAPTGRKLAEVLHDQFALQADAATVARIDSAFALFIKGGTPSDVPPIAAPVLVPVYRKMIASMAAYDPAKEVAALKRPPLVITGSTDIQTTRKDFDALRASRKDGQFVLLEGANHVLKRVESTTREAQLPSYQDPTLPIVPELVPTLVRWLRS
jgi:pimeloyl-ACP methyl ester carboxylesterase/uncharacterized membrane protein